MSPAVKSRAGVGVGEWTPKVKSGVGALAAPKVGFVGGTVGPAPTGREEFPS
ncbi:UNVERIFIED_CONTAM: hypothetical protein Sradi_6232500 [Sesamum radiatum]|uniref:Chlorophyll a-b binding protein, chloroplastic n=1 Tax=Sesamum radiatum TaxID=300843 RepID=A0AAW2K9W7_SESRA